MSRAARCPVCAHGLDIAGREHCDSPTCTWVRCECGGVVSQQGLWISPTPDA